MLLIPKPLRKVLFCTLLFKCAAAPAAADGLPTVSDERFQIVMTAAVTYPPVDMEEEGPQPVSHDYRKPVASLEICRAAEAATRAFHEERGGVAETLCFFIDQRRRPRSLIK